MQRTLFKNSFYVFVLVLHVLHDCCSQMNLKTIHVQRIYYRHVLAVHLRHGLSFWKVYLGLTLCWQLNTRNGPSKSSFITTNFGSSKSMSNRYFIYLNRTRPLGPSQVEEDSAGFFLHWSDLNKYEKWYYFSISNFLLQDYTTVSQFLHYC